MANPILSPDDIHKFWAKTRYAPNGCLEWTSSRHSYGYGLLKINGKRYSAHRVAWAISVGPIPDGMSVLHHCDNPACVREDHLFLGDQCANMRDMIAKGRHKEQQKTTCSLGHPLVPVRKNKSRTERKCLICYRKAKRDAYEKTHARVRKSPPWVRAGVSRAEWISKSGLRPISKLNRQEALAAGIPLPDDAIGVAFYNGATVLYPEVLPVVRIGHPAPCDIAEGQTVVVEFDKPDARRWGGSE